MTPEQIIAKLNEIPSDSLPKLAGYHLNLAKNEMHKSLYGPPRVLGSSWGEQTQTGKTKY